MILVVLFTALMLAVAVFQATLAAGAPLAAYSWGGKHSGVLPGRLRVASAASVLICVLIAAVVLDCAGLIDWLPDTISRPAGWVVFAYFVLGTIGNLASRSRRERGIMSPVSAILAVLTLFILLTAG